LCMLGVSAVANVVRRMGPVLKPAVQNFSKKVEVNPANKAPEAKWTPGSVLFTGFMAAFSVAGVGSAGKDIHDYVKTGEIPKNRNWEPPVL